MSNLYIRELVIYVYMCRKTTELRKIISRNATRPTVIGPPLINILIMLLKVGLLRTKETWRNQK
jgi:hypothetical protein